MRIRLSFTVFLGCFERARRARSGTSLGTIPDTTEPNPFRARRAGSGTSLGTIPDTTEPNPF
ncbi:unnamed protein product, partial [Adineta steineri]